MRDPQNDTPFFPYYIIEDRRLVHHVILQQDDGTRDLANQRTGFLLARFRIHGKEVTFVNVKLHSVPFEVVCFKNEKLIRHFQDVNEIAQHTAVTKAAQKRQEQIEYLLSE